MKTLLSNFGTAALIIFSTAVANGQTDVFTDTFDAAPTNGATRALSIDNSATNGQFPGSLFDVFGIVDRTVNFAFADDSVINNSDTDPANDDTYGLISAQKTDLFLGFSDVENADNPSGEVSVTWTVATAGQTNLNLSFDIAAIGDFETGDVLTFTASFDGGAAETLVTSTFIDTPDTETVTYTLEDGSLALHPFDNVTNIKDPMVVDGQQVNNVFQTFSFPITGSGSQMTLTLNYVQNGGVEDMAIDNVAVTTGGGGGVVLKGDVDLSGDVTFLDINPFIGVLAGNGSQVEADCNCDGMVSFLDIQAFIDILAGN